MTNFWKAVGRTIILALLVVVGPAIIGVLLWCLFYVLGNVSGAICASLEQAWNLFMVNWQVMLVIAVLIVIVLSIAWKWHKGRKKTVETVETEE